MASEQEIEVELDQPPVNGMIVVDPEPKGEEPDPAVEDLRQQLEAVTAREATEKTAREAAEKTARDHQAEITRLRESEAASRTETVDSQLDAVAQASAAAQSELTSAKIALKNAGAWRLG